MLSGSGINDQYPRYTHLSTSTTVTRSGFAVVAAVVVIVRLSRGCVGGAVEPLARSRQSCTAFNAFVCQACGHYTSKQA